MRSKIRQPKRPARTYQVYFLDHRMLRYFSRFCAENIFDCIVPELQSQCSNFIVRNLWMILFVYSDFSQTTWKIQFCLQLSRILTTLAIFATSTLNARTPNVLCLDASAINNVAK